MFTDKSHKYNNTNVDYIYPFVKSQLLGRTWICELSTLWIDKKYKVTIPSLCTDKNHKYYNTFENYTSNTNHNT